MIGVYFLKQDDKIVYVGQSINITNRIKTHKSESVKIFDSYTYIECKEDELNELEKKEIIKNRPLYNMRPKLGSNEYLKNIAKKKIDSEKRISMYGAKQPIKKKIKTKTKMLQVEHSTHLQIKDQAVENDMTIKDYVQTLADTHKDDRMTKISPIVINQLFEQSEAAGMFVDSYLELVLNLFKSQASHKKD